MRFLQIDKTETERDRQLFYNEILVESCQLIMTFSLFSCNPPTYLSVCHFIKLKLKGIMLMNICTFCPVGIKSIHILTSSVFWLFFLNAGVAVPSVLDLESWLRMQRQLTRIAHRFVSFHSISRVAEWSLMKVLQNFKWHNSAVHACYSLTQYTLYVAVSKYCHNYSLYITIHYLFMTISAV